MRCSVLIVLRNEETITQMSGILTSRGCHITDTCTTGMAGLRSAATHPCESVIVGFTLSDMTGIGFAESLSGISDASVLLIVPPDQMNFARESTGALDVSCLARPVTAQGLVTSIDMMLQFRERVQRMQNETKKLRAGLERRGLAERAKTALMRSLGLPEAEAWRRIQKQSMDTGKPLEQVAKHILEIYGSHDTP